MPEPKFFPGKHPARRVFAGQRFYFQAKYKTKKEAKRHAEDLRKRFGYSARIIPKYSDPLPYAVYSKIEGLYI